MATVDKAETSAAASTPWDVTKSSQETKSDVFVSSSKPNDLAGQLNALTKDNDKLTVAVGILAAVLGVTIIAVVIVFIIRRCRRRQRPTRMYSSDSELDRTEVQRKRTYFRPRSHLDMSRVGEPEEGTSIGYRNDRPSVKLQTTELELMSSFKTSADCLVSNHNSYTSGVSGLAGESRLSEGVDDPEAELRKPQANVT